MHRSQPLATTFFAGKKIAYCVNVFFFARNTTGSPSLVYKRGVWEISFDRETRILTKIIKLQLLTLFVCLWLNPTQWSQRLKQTRSVSWSFIIFVKILVSWSNEISHTSLLYTKLVLPVETLFLFSCKLCEYKVEDILGTLRTEKTEFRIPKLLRMSDAFQHNIKMTSRTSLVHGSLHFTP